MAEPNKIEQDLARLRAVLDNLMRTGTVVSKLDQSSHTIFPIGISEAEGNAVRDWVKRENASRTIEIGLAYGVSSLFICEALLVNANLDSTHTVIDPFQISGFKSCGLQILEEAGVSHLIEFHEAESQILLPKFLSEGRKFDLAFVDGSHLFDRVFLDLIYLGRLLTAGGVIIVDDYQMPAIARAVSFCVSNLGWSLEEYSAHDQHHQWAVMRTASELKPRTFRDFVDF